MCIKSFVFDELCMITNMIYLANHFGFVREAIFAKKTVGESNKIKSPF